MFTGENRQTLQTLIDKNTITETDQCTPTLALRATQTAIKDDRNKKSATMATRNSTKCPWRKFYKHITKYTNILHTEACELQEKIAKLVYAVTYHFASPIVDLEQNKKSTKQMQTTEQPRKMTLDQSSSTKDRTSNSDTDSAYSTESESNHTAPPPRPSKCQQITNTKCIQGTRPSCIPIPKPSTSTSYLSTSTHQPKPSTSTAETSHLSTSTCPLKPSTSTRSNTETTIKQPTVPATRTSSASTYPQCTRKTPLLPTPPTPARQFYNRNHYNQHISSPPRYSTYSAFSRPATLNNYR